MNIQIRSLKTAALLILAVLVGALTVITNSTHGETRPDPDELFTTSDQCQACHNFNAWIPLEYSKACGASSMSRENPASNAPDAVYRAT